MKTYEFLYRHIGPRSHEIKEMLAVTGVSSMDELIEKTIPSTIRLESRPGIGSPMTEYEYQQYLAKILAKNKNFKTYIGTGYYNTISPAVILRNIFENPAWYTSYTPYQAEISQGRLEALLNFQTAVSELTGCEIANASLLDEATAASEAMIMLANSRSAKEIKEGKNIFWVDENIFPQTLEVLQGRATPLNIRIETGKFKDCQFSEDMFGILLQYPAGDGKIENYKDFVSKAKAKKIGVVAAADILSLTLLTPPGEWGADVVVGSTQRFGIPIGYGGPHAAYFATHEKFKRKIPGRIIGISKDTAGNRALRMALQTREQHIKRDKATSNICTAQALLATMAGMYAVYHGKVGLQNIAQEIHNKAVCLSSELQKMGFKQANVHFFDTLRIELPKGIKSKELKKKAEKKKVNFRYFDKNTVGISIDETTSRKDLNRILRIFANVAQKDFHKIKDIKSVAMDEQFRRTSDFLTQDVFKNYRSETEMMRYIKTLERKDMSLTHSMISLGSCTMKLNPAVLMMPLTHPSLANLHPFVPKNQAKGYKHLIKDLSKDLLKITGFKAISFQPNSGASGEYTGLRVIRAYHRENNQAHRNVILIPASAHGTNPASAVMAGMKVIVVACDEKGNIDIADMEAKAKENAENLAGTMITYPSTHGVFESGVEKMCAIIHQYGGQVYMDGANMNAQVGLTNPAKIGADVCHLNLHKTFAIPHGGGGPGVGPIAVAEHLAAYLPGNHFVKTGGKKAIKAVSAAPYGSASILEITHGYLKMLGDEGLVTSTQMAILNANYIAASLKKYYNILYTGEHGFVAHEMILECRNFKHEADISEADIAKRLMDYGFHAPTLSFPVHGTLMVEPTESESKQELDKFIAAMKSIRAEIDEVKEGKADKTDNVLKNAPHSEQSLIADQWAHAYPREKAAYPISYTRLNKFQIPIGRIDDAFGDRNLVCSCLPIDAYQTEL